MASADVYKLTRVMICLVMTEISHLLVDGSRDERKFEGQAEKAENLHLLVYTYRCLLVEQNESPRERTDKSQQSKAERNRRVDYAVMNVGGKG